MRRCRYCARGQAVVVETRDLSHGGRYILYRCRKCGRRFGTHELPTDTPQQRQKRRREKMRDAVVLRGLSALLKICLPRSMLNRLAWAAAQRNMKVCSYIREVLEVRLYEEAQGLDKRI